jgi:hypothetical protein
MARPPIIISNGGVAEALATGINDPQAEAKIIANVKKLNERSKENHSGFKQRPIVREIISDVKKEDPSILWCLADEDIIVLKGKLKNLGCGDKNAELSG